MVNYTWSVETRFATEDGYPNKIEIDSLKIRSGLQFYPVGPTILRSSIGTARDLQRQGGLCNVVTFMGRSRDSFDANVFMESFGQDALNYDCEYLTWGQVWRTCKGKSLFCRPVSGWKPFAGGVLNEEDMYERLVEEKIPYSTLCLISPAKPIQAEYRFVVAGQNILGYTQYLPEESPTVPLAIHLAVKEFIKWLTPPDDIYVLDVCISENKIKLLEVNCVNTSGWYCMDVPNVCKGVEEFLIKENNLE